MFISNRERNSYQRLSKKKLLQQLYGTNNYTVRENRRWGVLLFHCWCVLNTAPLKIRTYYVNFLPILSPRVK